MVNCSVHFDLSAEGEGVMCSMAMKARHFQTRNRSKRSSCRSDAAVVALNAL